MSKFKNAPLIEVIFELKWGKTEQRSDGLHISFTQEEQALMPGKLQVAASKKGFEFLEVLKDRPPLPHLPKYRFRRAPEGYPLLQLGDGIFTVNQIDVDGYEYDWETFREDVRTGIDLLQESYPFPMKELPLLEIQLRYRDALPLPEGSCSLEYITNNFNIGVIKIPPTLAKNDNIDTSCTSANVYLQMKCKKPEGTISCQINQGLVKGNASLVIDFLVTSNFNVFPEITSDALMGWCINAHDHQKEIFTAIVNDQLMETFQNE